MKVTISLKLSIKPRVLLMQRVDGITSLTAMRNNNNSNNYYYIIITITIIVIIMIPMMLIIGI